MDKLRNAPGKNESSNRKQFSLLASLYSTRISRTESMVFPIRGWYPHLHARGTQKTPGYISAPNAWRQPALLLSIL
jgi:hypothetical protein